MIDTDILVFMLVLEIITFPIAVAALSWAPEIKKMRKEIDELNDKLNKLRKK